MKKVQACKGRNISMFSREFVGNAFLLAKVMSRINLQKIHRVFAMFISGSSWERTSRTNLSRSVRYGGQRLAIRQFISRFLFLRDQSDPFLCTVINVRHQRHLPEFIASSAQCMGRSVSGYLREDILSFNFLSVRFSREYLSTVMRKKLYND